MSEKHRHSESPNEPKGASHETVAENRDAGSTFLLMTRGGHAYGLPIEAIHQINWLPMLNPEEALPPPVIGSFDMAGTIVPVVDLDCLHGDPPRPWRTTDCVVILENHQHFFALLVDEVYDVVEAEPAPAPWDFSDGETAPPSLLSGRIEADDRLVSVLDIEVLREAVRAGRPDCALPELGTLLPADADERALLEERAHTLMSGVDKEEVQAGRPHVVA
ncbi:MAG: chemotaxis protein CheW, partial [Guyparkeria sp.]